MKQNIYNWQRLNTDLVNENENNIKGEIISKYDNHFCIQLLLLNNNAKPHTILLELE
jgi:ATP-dependent protease ClpP protease subunit